MPNIPGAPSLVTVTTGDCAEQKFLEFAAAQNQWNQAFCDLLVALTGDGGQSIRVIRDDHCWSGNGSEQIFLQPNTPLTNNCSVSIVGGACVPAISQTNQSQNLDTYTTEISFEIKCDGVVVVENLAQDSVTIDVPPGGSATVPKRNISINTKVDFGVIAKTPNPGVLSICATNNGNPIDVDVDLTSLEICRVELAQ